jgi:hypothetical protein
MNDEATTHDDDDEVTVYPGAPAPVDRKMLLIGLGGLTVIAGILFLVRRSVERVPVAQIDPGIVDGDWQQSLRHLADAFSDRCNRIDARLDELATEKVAAAAAAVSEPVAPFVVDDSEVIERPSEMVSRLGAGVSVDEPTPPPPPAAVSVNDS